MYFHEPSCGDLTLPCRGFSVFSTLPCRGFSVFSTLPCRDFTVFSTFTLPFTLDFSLFCLLLVHYLVRTFLFFFIFFFLFSFLRAHKKHKNANKQISDFFLFRCFLIAVFNFCSLICVLCFCLVVFLYFFCALWCFWCVRNLFVKKKKKFKTALITSFILLPEFFFWFLV